MPYYMAWKIKWRPVMFLFLIIISTICLILFKEKEMRYFTFDRIEKFTVPETMHLAVVSCGRPGYIGIKDFSKPLDQSLTMIKSASMFAKSPLHIHIFTEDEIKGLFEEEIKSWPIKVQARVKYSIYSADYSNQLPEELINEWKRWYKPCGSFRLFLPMILKNITDAAIYCDSDVVFVKPIDELWKQLKLMNERHVAGISSTSGHPISVPKSNEKFISDSNGKMFQINSGVMVLNFTRILRADWKMFHDVDDLTVSTSKYGADLLLNFYRKYKDEAEHDQKLLNIMFHFNSDLLYQLPCSWNFKNNFCTDDGNICDDAETNGAGAVHGISGSFFGDSNPTFKGLYEFFLMYKLGQDPEKKLYRRYLSFLGAFASKTYCGKKSRIITESLGKSVKEVDFITPDIDVEVAPAFE
ncbi:glucoside xylosyltransferase 1-like [Styela clava]